MEHHHFRPTWAEVDLKAIEKNIGQMMTRLPENCSMIAVVKADAYGHGAVEISKKALASGAEMLAVALLEEALVLREAGITAPILVLGGVMPRDVPVAVQQDVTLTCFETSWIHDVNQLNLPSPVKVHMKWDTGMGRAGLRTRPDLDAVMDALQASSSVELMGIYTHFATADEAGLDYFRMQEGRFADLLERFRAVWDKPVMVHTGNSAASIRYPDHMYDAVRFGISMYGLYPSDAVRDEQPIDLQPAFSLHSRLMYVKKISAGESVSYGATYTAATDEFIGTVPIGYADGWIRKLQGMDVLVAGKRMPIVGRITMDQTMIKLDKAYPAGTSVTLIGRQGNEIIEAEEIATKLDTISYEIPCMIAERVPRIYTS